MQHKIGDKVIVCEYVLDARCKSGLRKKPVTRGTVWRKEFAHDRKLGMLCYGVFAEDGNHVQSIPSSLILPNFTRS